MPPIYISDLDGTLLQNDTSLSEYARQTLTGLLDSGVPFTVATARSLTSTRQILGDLPLRLPIVEFNGAYVSDYRTGDHLLTNDFPDDVKTALLDFLLAHDCPPFISGFDGHDDCLYYAQIVNAGMAWYRDDRIQAEDKRLRPIAHLSDSLKSRIVCFTVIQENPAAKDIEPALREAFGEKIATYRYHTDSDPLYWLTIHDPRATKACGIRRLLESTGFTRQQLTVFGDNINDLPMFAFAARAIAVDNARPEVKAQAHRVIGSNQTDSVVRFIAEEYAAHRSR